MQLPEPVAPLLDQSPAEQAWTAIGILALAEHALRDGSSLDAHMLSHVEHALRASRGLMEAAARYLTDLSSPR